jgi:hypothetical protein
MADMQLGAQTIVNTPEGISIEVAINPIVKPMWESVDVSPMACAKTPPIKEHKSNVVNILIVFISLKL